jgi:hypothetical protein
VWSLSTRVSERLRYLCDILSDPPGPAVGVGECLLGQPTGDLPGEAMMLILGKTRIGRTHLDFSTTRYVAGYGNGFTGVWDRRSPAHPIRRFEPGQVELAVRTAFEMETSRPKGDRGGAS